LEHHAIDIPPLVSAKAATQEKQTKTPEQASLDSRLRLAPE
jgi:hypothetical protein